LSRLKKQSLVYISMLISENECMIPTDVVCCQHHAG